MINLISKENSIHKIKYKHAKKSILLKDALEDYEEKEEDESTDKEQEDKSADEEDEEQNIPLPTVDKNMLEYIVCFLEHDDVLPEIETPINTTNIDEIEIPTWYKDFVKKLSMSDLKKLANMSGYFGIEDLITLTSLYIATLIKDKTEDEIRKILF
jgi:hypothetical protein